MSTAPPHSPPPPPHQPSFARRHPILTGFGVLAGLSLFAAYFPVSAIVTAVIVGAHASGADRAGLRLAERGGEWVRRRFFARPTAPPPPPPAAPAPGLSARTHRLPHEASLQRGTRAARAPTEHQRSHRRRQVPVAAGAPRRNQERTIDL